MKTRLLALALALVSASAYADGLIVVHDPPHHVPGHFRFAPLEVVYHKVEVDIEGQVATTSIDQDFYNPNDRRMEGTYIFPLPEGAHIDTFVMDVNGKELPAELLPADKARALYEEIVRKARDPALLEYVGRGAFKVRIFPIEPKSHKRIKIRYTELLKSDTGLTEYVYPLNTEKFSSAPVKNVSVRVRIKTKDPLRTVYCPTHNAEVTWHGKNEAVVGFEETDSRPDTDFKVIFSRTPKPLGVDLLTFRDAGKDGYFLLLASPGHHKSAKVLPKDICFVIDTSGSMAEGKLDQAKKALRFCLANLNSNDGFEIIRFSTEAESFFGRIVESSDANIKKAAQFVKGLKPIGGTAMSEAIEKALDMQSNGRDGRPYLVVFLTDGLPTIGELKEEKIVDMAADKNRRLTRMFTFGIGSDVNTHLLDRLAADTRAISQYVTEEEDLEIKLSNFYRKIKDPILTDVELGMGESNVRLTQLYPRHLPDVFNGDMLTVFGRYRGHGSAELTIKGIMGGRKRDFRVDVEFARKRTRDAFIPRLWATRRVGWLLDEIRRNGESKELKDEVTALAREFGIITPYTAYLILEDEAKRDVPVARRNFRELENDEVSAREVARSALSWDMEAQSEEYRSGNQAVDNAMSLQKLKGSRNVQQSVWKRGLAKSGGKTRERGYRSSRNYAGQVRIVKNRAFYQNGSQWVDSTAQALPQLKNRTITFGSKDYFALLRKHPEAGQWLALGIEVDVVLEGVLYQVR
ncbi:MAG: VWA domain-containing protein [Lentisphaerae bacterium]|nr:VWA domain-containing protein [Lentisphaerota bacterium]